MDAGWTIDWTIKMPDVEERVLKALILPNPHVIVTACALLMLASSPSHAANRCIDSKGRVTYQDAPCDGPTSGRVVDTTEAFSTHSGRSSAALGGLAGTDAAYASFRGAWRGPAQLKLTIGSTRDDPPGISAAVIEVKSDGEVSGFVGQGGCRLSGLATQAVVPTVGSLGVTLSRCPDPRFNGRYQGQLGVFGGSKEATLTLSAVSVGPGGRITQTRVDAVLKR